MFRKFFALALLATITLGFVTSAQAQSTDVQKFRVTVPSLMSITSPAALVSQLHDQSDSDQSFPLQRWSVRANGRLGAIAVFTTDHAFTHTTDSTYKRNAALTLTKVTGGNWAVTTASAATNYGAGTEVVSVAAGSNKAGSGTFDLGVKLVEETFSDLAAGDYEMTITGTLTAN